MSLIDSEITIGILRVLRSCGGYAVREDLIYVQYNSTAMTVQTMAALREHLQHAKDKGWADFIVDEIDRSKKWFITPEGKVLLQNR